MPFHPEHLFDTNRGENFVWAALKIAFSDEAVEAFYRYPIVGSDGFVRYEPDVLLMLPDRMPLILECKGCRLEQIENIQGAVWTMSSSWHRLQERPVTQARSQAIALHQMFDGRGIFGVQVQSLVALPFVSRDDWVLTPFGGLAGTNGILFAEDFEHKRLRDRIRQCLSEQPLDAARHRGVLDCLAATRRADSDAQESVAPTIEAPLAGTSSEFTDGHRKQVAVPTPIRLLRYPGRPPTAEEIRIAIGLDAEAPYTYLVATAALERQRRKEGLGGHHQLKKDLRADATNPEEMQLLFHKALRHFIGKPVLTRAEEGVVLQRSIREAVAHDPHVAEQLLRDVFTWRDVLADLEEMGTDLSEAGPADDFDWMHPSLREVARTLQSAYRKARQDAGRGKTSFEDLAGQYLDRRYRPTPVVVLEGFTRLTALQRRFITVCAGRSGCAVWIVQPYRGDQDRGFAAIRRTYEPFSTQLEIVEIETEPLCSESALCHVQQGLFALHAGEQAFPGDSSVQLQVFPHRNDEVAACVDAVIRALDDVQDPLPAQQIAVVCSDPAGMTALLREQAELRDRADLFELPPRQLLLTPVGRFALTLYEIWTPHGLRLEPEQFATLLASGWLGGQAQRSVDRFLAVAAQQFTHCRTEDDWHGAFERIRSQRETDATLGRLALRLPASQVDLEQLSEWEDVVRISVRLCKRLFRPEERPLGDHIHQLLDEIEQLDQNRILATEREILTRIRDALAELTEARSVAVDGYEFGQILSGLIRERQDQVDGDLSGSVPTRFPDRVWVVGPEGVDNITRHTVFFLGVDDFRMPAPGVPPWPRAQWSAQEHIERQRYRFFAVVRSAQRQMWLSYARQDWARDYRPSLYLEEVARLLRRQAELECPRATPAYAAATPAPTAARRGLRALRDEYDLDELALFRLCPHRFKLESLSGWGRCYGDNWQLEWMSRGAWLAEVFAHVASTLPGDAAPDAVETALKQAIDTVRPSVESRFAGISRLAWVTIERDVRKSVDYLLRGSSAEPIAGIQWGPEIPRGKEVVLDGRRSVTVRAHSDFLQRRGRGHWILSDTNQAAAWLLYGKESAPASEGVDEDLEVFRRLYDAVGWWRNLLRKLSGPQPLVASDNNDLIDTVMAVEAARFPKNPGDHCRYCPVVATCMGLKP